ncbi:hypothetical protein GLOIN_2v1641104 [Rhizophagus irregularis DAOM 181602=DAOM 197198]|uniref:Transmembrane protein n=1 Tax=Rhizophagus irregularis (strain DAOM 181602 / DAOM 197198 / MUCL 43194) TaxID=747089 RepID=A0A2P4PRH9_RHIID|nr:hypothetical protein GLOIN_2v1641104 [Rhizophagus irregularis DAOM 181602=DAOM 197198]POG67999.1 hypothetical protein GLOIN_2v1641104 [Rhizophagus irregularis DAOM 181602=DAOM 197198]|eukprot:XP_025174865.1 hypothetical protein GLOIN_2v1641104 [Rhizophagus irregularis DAOM 181602=DAOM 197198]
MIDVISQVLYHQFYLIKYNFYKSEIQQQRFYYELLIFLNFFEKRLMLIILIFQYV